MGDFIIRLETNGDEKITENLTREAFWNVYRPGCEEHYVLHCFRSSREFVHELNLVMVKEGEIIGHVMYVKSEIETLSGEKIPILTLGPISIAPKYKRQGYGSELLKYSLNKAESLGYGAVELTGNISFYGKAGFAVAKTVGVTYKDDPNADYFLIKELKEGFLDGVKGSYHDPEGYFVDSEKAAEFDSLFPPKEKKKLPGQLV